MIFSFGHVAANTVIVQVEPNLDLCVVSVHADFTTEESVLLHYLNITTTTELVRNFLPKN